MAGGCFWRETPAWRRVSRCGLFAGCIIPSYVLVLPLISLVLPTILLPVSIYGVGSGCGCGCGCLAVHCTVGIMFLFHLTTNRPRRLDVKSPHVVVSTFTV
jgi:hypothetical protein